MRYPKWTIWCFEPDEEAFAALERNIRRYSLSNIRAVPVTIGPRTQQDLPQSELAHALQRVQKEAEHSDRLATLCVPKQFFRHKDLCGYCDIAPDPAQRAAFNVEHLPCLPADTLASLAPDLMKITAPGVEEACLAALTSKPLRYLVGESWRSLPARFANVTTQGVWLPFAKTPDLALRNPALYPQSPTGLDLVVNAGAASPQTLKAATQPFIKGTFRTNVHVVVAPDSPISPDFRLPGCTVHRAARSGFGAAMNFGRQFAGSSHIAFLDIGDRFATGALAALFELAVLTQAEVVQGGASRGPRWVHFPPGDGFALHQASFPNQTGGMLHATELMSHFSPTRARLYRRDFLDARGIGFSEALSGFDDFLLQGRVMLAVDRVPILPSAGLNEAPAPAMREEHILFLPEALRQLVHYSVVAGLEQHAPLLDAFDFALRDHLPKLSPAIMVPVAEAIADALVATEMALGPTGLGEIEARARSLPIIGLKVLEGIAARKSALGDIPTNAAIAWLSGPLPRAHPID
jgi:hypothetical protein